MITLGPCLKILCMKFFIITLGPGLKILFMKFVRAVGSVHIVIVFLMKRFQTGKNLTVYAAVVLLRVLQADADKQ
jgi:hypothetical protein